MADKLALWDLANNTEIAGNKFLDIEVKKGELVDYTFGIRNLSKQYTANNVLIKIVDEDTAPSLASQILFSYDKWTFVDILSIGDIPPTAVSAEITMRRIPSFTSVSGSFTIRVEMASWT